MRDRFLVLHDVNWQTPAQHALDDGLRFTPSRSPISPLDYTSGSSADEDEAVLLSDEAQRKLEELREGGVQEKGTPNQFATIANPEQFFSQIARQASTVNEFVRRLPTDLPRVTAPDTLNFVRLLSAASALVAILAEALCMLSPLGFTLRYLVIHIVIITSLIGLCAIQLKSIQRQQISHHQAVTFIAQIGIGFLSYSLCVPTGLNRTACYLLILTGLIGGLLCTWSLSEFVEVMTRRGHAHNPKKKSVFEIGGASDIVILGPTESPGSLHGEGLRISPHDLSPRDLMP